MGTNERRNGLLGLELGFSDRKDAILAGALVLVIIAAVTMAVRGMSSRNKDLVFECTQCHRQFTQFKVAYDDPEVLASSMGPYGVVKVCPRCDQRTGVWTIRCPACHENILRPDNKICPKCGANIEEELIRLIDQAKERAAARNGKPAAANMPEHPE